MRKFEKISKEQWDKDICDYIYIDAPVPKYEDIKIPERSTSKSAGYDFYSPIDIDIPPCSMAKIPLGIKAEIEDDDVLLMFIRSSIAIKNAVQLMNNVGVIDADYYNNVDNEGHIWAALYNVNAFKPFHISKGQKICQGIIVKYGSVDNDDVNTIREGGFGSTGN